MMKMNMARGAKLLILFGVAYATTLLAVRLVFWWLVKSAESQRKAHLSRLEHIATVELIVLPFSIYVFVRLRTTLLALWHWQQRPVVVQDDEEQQVDLSLPVETATRARPRKAVLVLLVRLSRHLVTPTLLVFLAFVHSANLIYYFQGVVPQLLAWLVSLCLGVYAHLAVFLVMFALLNLACRLLRVESKRLLSRLCCTEANWQTLMALAGTVFFSAVSIWAYSSTRLVQVDVYFDTAKASGRPPPWEGKKIALLTDVHVGSFVGENWLRSAVQLTNSARPDVVAIVGDLLDGTVESLSVELLPLRELRSRHGVFFVTGNHEYYMGRIDEWLSFLKGLALRPLRNANVNLNFGICLAGTDDVSAEYSGLAGHKMDARKALKGCNASTSLSVLLQHNPNAVGKIVAESSPDLVLSGHTHAGQLYVLMPLAWAVFRYLHGLYKVNNQTQVYVSAGVFSYAVPMKTLNGGSEITVITLKSK